MPTNLRHHLHGMRLNLPILPQVDRVKFRRRFDEKFSGKGYLSSFKLMNEYQESRFAGRRNDS